MLSKHQSPCRAYQLWDRAPGICCKEQSVLLFDWRCSWCQCGLAFMFLACVDTPSLTSVMSVFWGKPEPLKDFSWEWQMALQPDPCPLCSFFYSLDSNIRTLLHVLYMLPFWNVGFSTASNSIYMKKACEALQVVSGSHNTENAAVSTKNKLLPAQKLHAKQSLSWTLTQFSWCW